MFTYNYWIQISVNVFLREPRVKLMQSLCPPHSRGPVFFSNPACQQGKGRTIVLGYWSATVRRFSVQIKAVVTLGLPDTPTAVRGQMFSQPGRGDMLPLKMLICWWMVNTSKQQEWKTSKAEIFLVTRKKETFPTIFLEWFSVGTFDLSVFRCQINCESAFTQEQSDDNVETG